MDEHEDEHEDERADGFTCWVVAVVGHDDEDFDHGAASEGYRCW